MEPIGGCTDLNVIHGFDDSRREYLRNIMVYQEELFKKQVIELHRVYWVQRDLMKKIGIKGPAEINQYSPCGEERSRADVKIGWQNGGGRNDYREKCVELGSMGDARNASLASQDVPACSGDNQDSPDCVLSMYSIGNSSIMHVPYGGTTSSLDEILSSGPRHHQDGHHSNDEKKNTASSFCEGQELDLNKYPCDESFSQCHASSFCEGQELDLNKYPCDESIEKFSDTKIVQVGNGHALSKVSPRRMSHDNDSSACTNSSPCSVDDAKPQPFQETDEEPPEFVTSEQRDAVCFLLNGFSKDQDAVEETSTTEKLEKELPQYSSETFESIVLKLPESNVDDYCVTSKLYEVDDTSTRDCGIKLRRGSRRIKDFRKDVLPHLPSLSSKEIWEDLKIMQDALRSREYKRLRSKAQNEQSGSSPLKSTRTRCNRVTRRRNT